MPVTPLYRFDIFQGLFKQGMPKLLPAAFDGNDYAADHYVTSLGLGVEDAGVGHQLVVLPAHHMQRIARQVLPVDVLIGAFLLGDKYF